MLQKLIRRVGRNALFQPLIRVWSTIRRKRRHPIQSTRRKRDLALENLGSEYGGWVFHPSERLAGATIVSAGLGEDASFDLEFAAKFGAKIIVMDPTPRAIDHFNAIVKSLGALKSAPYSSDGKQSICSYDLSKITSENLLLVEKALWKETGTLKFFEPSNPDHVSHSVVNFQNNYSQDGKYIEVAGDTLINILDGLGVDPARIALVKLDIEGAEIEVLQEFLEAGLHPEQILVEFDELNRPTDKAFERVDGALTALRRHGYECVYTDGRSDFLFLRDGNSKLTD